MDHKVVTDYTKTKFGGENAKVKVFVRARPCGDGSEPVNDVFEVTPSNPTRITIREPHNSQYGEHAFSFDHVYWTETTQEQIFQECCKSLVDYGMKGINSSCFAYGQTGSGKTHSIFGDTVASSTQRGIVSRSVKYLFELMEQQKNSKTEIALAVSFLEIYCDQIRDLGREYLSKTGKKGFPLQADTQEWYLKNLSEDLSESDLAKYQTFDDEDYDYEKANLMVHEDVNGNIFVKDSSLIPVTSPEEVYSIVGMGLKLRATYETKMNAVSSRSHTVFVMHIFQRDKVTEEAKIGMLNLIDLAGSERVKKSESHGQRLKEALHINTSLSAIGKVVMSLDPENHFAHIPYRDSKLTRLLQNSIGGNAYSILLATIHPMREHYEECLSTLQFANRCRSVQNQPRVNYIGQSASDKERRIKKLVEEISFLRRQLENLRSQYNSRLMAALSEAGVKILGISEHGGIQLENGKVIYAEPTAPEGSEDIDEGLVNLNLSSNQAIANMDSLSQTQKISILEQDRNILRKKVACMKDETRKNQARFKKQKDELQMKISEQKRVIASLREDSKMKRGTFNRMLEGESSRYNSELQEIVGRNRKLLEEQNTLLNKIPEALKVKSESLSRARENETNVIKKSEDRLSETVKAIEAAKEEEINIIKEQYDYWLVKKETEIENFIAEFNEYRRKTQANAQQMKVEFAELYQYATQILDVSRAHQFSSRSMENIPDLLSDPSKFSFCKSQIVMDAKLRKQVLECTPNGNSTWKSKMNARPGSAPIRRPGSAPMARPTAKESACGTNKRLGPVAIPRRMRPPLPNKARVKDSGGKGINMDEENNPIEGMTHSELTEYVKRIKEHNLDTVEQLESKLKSESQKLRDLRAAYIAQKRQIDR